MYNEWVQKYNPDWITKQVIFTLKDDKQKLFDKMKCLEKSECYKLCSLFHSYFLVAGINDDYLKH